MSEQHQELTRDIELTSCSENRYQNNQHLLPYFKADGTLYHVLDGIGTFELNGVPWLIKAGECLWVPPRTVLSIWSSNMYLVRVRQYKIHILDQELLERIQRIFPPLTVDGAVGTMLNYLFVHRNDRDSFVRLTCNAFMRAILSLYFIGEPHPRLPASAFVSVDNYSPATQKMINRVEENFYRRISMQEIAKELGYHKNYLSSIFSHDTGVTFLDYSNFHLARLGVVFFFFWGFTVQETSERLRFSHPSYFSKIFKKFVGIPPRDFYRACLALTTEERSHIAFSEPVLSYHPMPIGDLFGSLRHLGETMAEILKQKSL